MANGNAKAAKENSRLAICNRLGLCGTCGKKAGRGAKKRPAWRGSALICGRCYKKYRDKRTGYEAVARARRRKEGKCWLCRKKADPDKTLCRDHLEAAREREKQRAKARAAAAAVETGG